jgi:hypothetical protein
MKILLNGGIILRVKILIRQMMLKNIILTRELINTPPDLIKKWYRDCNNILKMIWKFLKY